MPTVQPYEVQYAVHVDGKEELTTFVEYAYDAVDAWKQANLNLASRLLRKYGSMDKVRLDLLKIGPPSELIQAASSGLNNDIAKYLEKKIMLAPTLVLKDKEKDK